MSRPAKEFYQEMCQKYSELSGFLPDDASDIAIRLRIVAAQLEQMQTAVSETAAQASPLTASGESLDAFAMMRGLFRKAATPARGMLEFSVRGEHAGILIPKGTVCCTMDGCAYATMEDAECLPDTAAVTVPAQSMRAGSGFGASPNTICMIRENLGYAISVTNPAAFSDGQDAEDDEALRARMQKDCQKPSNGTNSAFYVREACAFAEISDAVVKTGESDGEIQVTVAASQQSGVPAETIEGLFAHLNSLREPCAKITVKAARVEHPEIQITLLCKAPLSGCIPSLKEQLTKAARQLSIGAPLTLARIGQILMDSGLVENYHILSPRADIVCTDEQVIRVREEDISIEPFTAE